MADPRDSLCALALAESRVVLAALRRNGRFAAASSDHPLVSQIKSVKEAVRAALAARCQSSWDAGAAAAAASAAAGAAAAADGTRTLDAALVSRLLTPFLAVIRSPLVGGLTTSAALQASSRILSHIEAHDLVAPPPSLAPVLADTIAAAAVCRFDPAEPSTDEVVLSRISSLAAAAATGRAAGALSDASVLAAMETSLHIAGGGGRRRATDLLRASSAADLLAMVRRHASLAGTFVVAAAEPAAAAAAVGRPRCCADADAGRCGHEDAWELATDAVYDVPVGTAAAVAGAPPAGGGAAGGGGGGGGALSVSGGANGSVTADARRVSLGGDAGSGAPLPTVAFSRSAPAAPLPSTVSRPPTRTPPPPPTSSFTYSFADADRPRSAGPATFRALRSILRLASRMADPSATASTTERGLGLAMLSAALTAGGGSLAAVRPLRAVLRRDASLAVVRGIGNVADPPPLIAAAWAASHLLLVSLGPAGGPLLSAVLTQAAPVYIAGVPVDAGSAPDRRDDPREAPAIPWPAREVGLEALVSLVATPGLLASAFSAYDCAPTCSDAVGPLLEALRASAARLPTDEERRWRLGEEESDDDDFAVGGSGGGDNSHVGGGGGSGRGRVGGNDRGALAYAEPDRAASLLCAEALAAAVDGVGGRLLARSVVVPVRAESDASLVGLLDRRRAKTRTALAAQAFNTSKLSRGAVAVVNILSQWQPLGSERVATVAGNGTGASAPSAGTSGEAGASGVDAIDAQAAAVARFFRAVPGLNKAAIGNILGEPDPLSRAVLAHFTASFNFADRPFTSALRVFLESFRLPGESQKIDRVVQSFASHYHEQNTGAEKGGDASGGNGRKGSGGSGGDADGGGALSQSTRAGSGAQVAGALASADAAYVLAFAVVMLNTDQHNSSVRKKMELSDFIRNNRGINDGEDVPHAFLAEVFDSIAAVEIRMSDEAGIAALTEEHWDESLRVTPMLSLTPATAPSSPDARAADTVLFSCLWPSAVAAALASLAASSPFETSGVQQYLESLVTVARCGSALRRTAPVDAAVSVLAGVTGLREGPLSGAILRFGGSIKAQMAAVALFGAVRVCGDWLRAAGWQAFVDVVLRLHTLCLLPSAAIDQGFGPDLVDADGNRLQASRVTPRWWPGSVARRLPPELMKRAKQRRDARRAAKRRGRGGLATANGFLTAVGGLFGAASGTFRAARAGLSEADEAFGGSDAGDGGKATAAAASLPRRPASSGDLTSTSGGGAGGTPATAVPVVNGISVIDDHSDLELFDENDLSTSESDTSAEAPAFGPRARVPAFLRLRGRDAVEARALARKSLADSEAAQSLVAEAKFLRSEALACFADALSQSAALAVTGSSDGDGEGTEEREHSPSVTSLTPPSTTAAEFVPSAAQGQVPSAGAPDQLLRQATSRDSSDSSSADIGPAEAEDAAALAALLDLLPLAPPLDCIAVVGDYVPPRPGDNGRDASGGRDGGGFSLPLADGDSGDYGGAATGEEDSDSEVSFWAGGKRGVTAGDGVGTGGIGGGGGSRGGGRQSSRRRSRDETAARDAVAAGAIDLLAELTLANEDRLVVVWPACHAAVSSIVAPARSPSGALERGAVGLMRVAARLLHRPEVQADVLRSLALFVQLPPPALASVSVPVASGVLHMVSANAACVRTTPGWHAILSLVEVCARCPPVAAATGFRALSVLLCEHGATAPSAERPPSAAPGPMIPADSGGEALAPGDVGVSVETFLPLLDAVVAYTASPDMGRSVAALNLLHVLAGRVRPLADKVDQPSALHGATTASAGGVADASAATTFAAGTAATSATAGNADDEPSRAWSDFWGPLLRALAAGGRDHRGRVRNHALVQLERVASEAGAAAVQLAAADWCRAFTAVLFPLADTLAASDGMYAATLAVERDAQAALRRGSGSGASRRPAGPSSAAAAAAAATSDGGAADGGAGGGRDAKLLSGVRGACARTRLHAADVVARTFLQHHAVIAGGLGAADFGRLWLAVLTVLRRLVGDGNGGLREHVGERLKNVVLVMASSGLLDVAGGGGGSAGGGVLWDATMAALGDWLPDVATELRAVTGGAGGGGSNAPSPLPSPPEGGEAAVPPALTPPAVDAHREEREGDLPREQAPVAT